MILHKFQDLFVVHGSLTSPFINIKIITAKNTQRSSHTAYVSQLITNVKC